MAALFDGMLKRFRRHESRVLTFYDFTEADVLEIRKRIEPTGMKMGRLDDF